ncbi:hypothetical protein EGW08_005922, partial [Elysia chlorotica]
WYWVDPNQGSIDDAVQVWCNMTTDIETCVYPTQKTKMVGLASFFVIIGYKNESFLRNPSVGVFQIKYVSSIQLGMLRLLSERASQRFTYFCSGSVAYEDSASGNTNHAIELLGDNDFDFRTGRFNSKQVEHDGCKDRGPNGFTTFVISTRKLERLPIVSFRPMDYGEPFQKFGFEAGPVCFQ